MGQLGIAVVGAGAIGRAHAELIAASDVARLVAIADPADDARALAERLDVAWFADHRAMLAAGAAEAVIVATPNDLHLPVALDALKAGLPTLVEKPIASSVAEGEAIAAASRESGAPVLVGHHRRHNPIIQEARRLVRAGAIGAPTSIAVLSNVYKPDAYFALEWRRRAGAGPVLINMIHEIDLLRFVCGEIASVQAMTSNARRGFEVEDTAAVALRFANGALGTISLSDTAVSPWSWDLSSGELAPYPPQPAPAPSHFFAGTEGAIALPSLDRWSYRGDKSWFQPMTLDRTAIGRESPYVRQLRHLCAVARGAEKPLIDADDGVRTLRATLAVHESARSGALVHLQD